MTVPEQPVMPFRSSRTKLEFLNPSLFSQPSKKQISRCVGYYTFAAGASGT
jgi:hypothetical protein